MLLPEINTRNALVEVSLIYSSDSALWEENANEWRIVATRPVFDGENQGVCVMLGWVGKFEHAIQRNLNENVNRSDQM